MTLLAEVTRRAITLGSRDAITGWRAITYSSSTIDMPTTPKGTNMHLGTFGIYAYMDLAGICISPVDIFDQIILQDGRTFLVQASIPYYVLDSLQKRDVHMSELPLWQASPSATATWKTAPSDARNRTKIWIDTYVLNANILKDDATTQAKWACIFNDPPYPVALEFRSVAVDSVQTQGLYVVGQSTLKPLMDATTQAPYGYEESVPITIATVDSTGCSGNQLNWRMEAELRRIAETYPTGSQRSIEARRENNQVYGGFTVYQTDVDLKYRRRRTV